MSFVEQFKQLNWDDISMSIYAKTAQDVERALNKPKRDLEDFKALISPAAEAYLEQMAQLSYSALVRQCLYLLWLLYGEQNQASYFE